MTRSDRDPDAHGKIRDDALGTNWPDAAPASLCDICGDPAPVDPARRSAFHTCNQDGVRRRVAELEAQLAAAKERERAARKLAGQWASNYLGLLISQIEQPENEWMLEMLRPELTQIAAALAAAQEQPQ